MNEIETILGIRGIFPTSPQQRNEVLTCDAELVNLGGQLYGISMDDFSYEEDLLPCDDLHQLGANLAVATVSDLLAAGCLPQFYLHSIVEPHGHEGFAHGLSKGVQTVLRECGCFLLGGDMGSSAAWRYTGVALGQCFGAGENREEDARRDGRHAAAITPLTRIIPHERQKLWITGTLGDGNLCAFAGHAPHFELRLNEAKAMRGIATACMDTSGGLVESLLLLQRLNPEHRFEVHTGELPFAAGVAEFAQAHGLPLQGFAFGGAGEYELLFTTAEDVELDFATHIGTVIPAATAMTSGVSAAPGVYWDGGKLLPALPEPRMYADKRQYIDALLEVVKQCAR